MGRVNQQYHISKPRLSMVLSGTGSQLKNLINNIENGLFSRFLCYTFNADLAWKNPFKTTNTNLERFIEEQGKQLLEWWNVQYDFEEDVVVNLTEEQQQKVNEYFSKRLVELTDNLGIEAAANVYRFGLMHFRICMILTIIRAFDNEDDFTEELYVDDKDFEIATKIMDCAFVHLEKVFCELTHHNKMHRLSKQYESFYDALPEVYSTADFEEIGLSFYASKSGAYKAHKKLIELGLIRSIGRAKYQKMM